MLWVFGFMMDQFIRPNRTAVLSALRAFRAAELTDVDRFISLQEHSKTYTTSVLAFGSRDALSSGYNNRHRIADNSNANGKSRSRSQYVDEVVRQEPVLHAATTTKSVAERHAAARTQWRTTQNGTQLVPMGGEFAHLYDFNYVRYKGRPRELAAAIACDMTATSSGGGRSLNAEQVRAELRQLEHVEIRSAPYVQNERFGEPGPAGLYPVRRDDTVAKKPFHAVRFDERTSAMFVFSGLLFAGAEKTPFQAVCDACLDEFTPRATYLAGSQYKPTTPHLFATYEVAPVPGRRLEFCMPSSVKTEFAQALYGKEELSLRAADAARDDAPPWMRSESFMITEPIDEFATRYRLHAISLPHDCAPLVVRYLPRETDALVRMRDTPWCQLAEPAMMWRYPNDAECTLPQGQRADNFFRDARDKSVEELRRDPRTRHRVTHRADVRSAQARKRVLEFGDPMLIALQKVAAANADAQDGHLSTARSKRARAAIEDEEAAAKRARTDAEEERVAVSQDDDDADESHERRLADVADIEPSPLAEAAVRVAEQIAAAHEEAERAREFGEGDDTITASGAYHDEDYSHYLSVFD